MPTEVGVVVYDGFDELDAVGPFEVFQNAGRHADCRARICTLDEREMVTASHGLRVEPDETLREHPANAFDLLVVPGGGWNTGDGGARTVVEDGSLPAWIAKAHAAGATVAAVCTGGMILEATGLLDGRPAVTHHGALDDLRDSAADVVDARVVDDGDVLTCGGVTAGLDLSLWLVEREFGDAVVRAVSEVIEYDRRGGIYRG